MFEFGPCVHTSVMVGSCSLRPGENHGGYSRAIANVPEGGWSFENARLARGARQPSCTIRLAEGSSRCGLLVGDGVRNAASFARQGVLGWNQCVITNQANNDSSVQIMASNISRNGQQRFSRTSESMRGPMARQSGRIPAASWPNLNAPNRYLHWLWEAGRSPSLHAGGRPLQVSSHRPSWELVATWGDDRRIPHDGAGSGSGL